MPRSGVQNHNSRLNPKRVSLIRGYALLGVSPPLANLARRWGVTRKAIRDARDGVTWGDVPPARRCGKCKEVVGVREDGGVYSHGCK